MYVDIFEHSIPDHAFAISQDENIRGEVEKSLSTMAGSVRTEYSSVKGSSGKKKLDAKLRRFHIFQGQTESVSELREEIVSARDEIVEWRAKYDNLNDKLKTLYNEMQQAVNERDMEIERLQTVNSDLKKHIEDIENKEKLVNKGKDIAEVKNKYRTLKTFCTRAETAMWFSKSFGLELNSITVKEIKTGKVHFVKPKETSSSSNQQPREYLQENNGSENGFDGLCEDEKDKLEKILFLLDKFFVGDAFYHELSMVCDGLPKSYLIKQRRQQLNDICHITPHLETREHSCPSRRSSPSMLKIWCLSQMI